MKSPVTIVVSPLCDASATIAEFKPNAVISLVSPRLRLARFTDRPHLILRFHDIEAPRRGCIHPDMKAVAAIVEFTGAAAGVGGRLLIHCKAGLSRSPAAALIASWALCGDPAARMDEWAKLAPWMQPNRVMLALGSAALGYEVEQVLALVDEHFPPQRRAWFGAVGDPGRTVKWTPPAGDAPRQCGAPTRC